MSKNELKTIVEAAKAKKTEAFNTDMTYTASEYKTRLSDFLDAEFSVDYLEQIGENMQSVYADSVKFVEDATNELLEVEETRVILEMEEIARKKYMHSKEFKADMPNGKLRGVLHNYFRTIDRRDMIEMFLSSDWNKKRLKFRIKGILRDVSKAVIESPKTNVVANALLERLAKYVPSQIEGINVEAGMKNNIVMTILQVFVDMNVLNIEVVQDRRTKAWSHMVSVPFAEEHMTVTLFESYKAVNGRRALFTEPKDVNPTDKLVSTGSWYYKSPELSGKVQEFLNIQNQTRLNIVENDELMEKAIIRKYYDEDDAKGMRLEDMEPWMRTRAIKFYEELQDIREFGGFYVNHFIDSKYRSYEKSELFGVQQNSAARALVEFAAKTRLNEDGIEAMKLDIACKAGYDKATMEEALHGFEVHEKTWREDPKLKREFEALDSDGTSFIIYQDATNSGTQMYAIATGSKRLAQISGLVKGERFDAYSMLAEELNKALGVACFNRKNVKSIFMTKLYNAGKELILNGKQKNQEDMLAIELMETHFGPKKEKLIPLQKTLADNEHFFEDDHVYAKFETAMNILAPIALQMMEAIGQIDDRELYTWEMPDGATAQSARYDVIEEDVIWSNETGNRHHFIHRRKIASKGKKKAALAPGIIHSMDSYALRETVRRCAEAGIETVTIHDSIGSHPNHAVAVRTIYRMVLGDMFEADIMSNIFNQLLDKEYSVQNIVHDNDKLTYDDIINSEYGLWA